ncbi:hypothetical protein VC03_01875 [Sneathia vaginalis]|uniref:tRNA dimethylallyltransferase n=1 Tax=Sneathia vaginalis TaxID=187101 RepID=A0A0E3ZB94_9FUSO|nr:tRNA (adenosine(37)-N6)-dimethylallyltransferase MiaA [Sneathia vaginalis]AKC96120.1 hypothetical protein VC03_01875 [Sneathia vaginalis]
MYNAIVIAGPTGVGKTELSIKLAKLLNARIISADASQVYKTLDIGTAKITEDEKDGVIHYLIDEVEPNEKYSVGHFYEAANKILNENREVPFLIVGGTGLYISSLTDGLTMMDKVDYKKREKLESMTLSELQDLLSEEEKKQIDIKNKVRVIRKIETRGVVYNNKLGNDRKFLKIFLTRNRATLYDRINKRVDIMMEQGLLEEAKKAYNVYGDKIHCIGYKQLFEYFKSNVSLKEAIENIKTASRRYAKRQFTWFKNKGYIEYNLDDESIDKIIEKIRRDYGN